MVNSSPAPTSLVQRVDELVARVRAQPAMGTPSNPRVDLLDDNVLALAAQLDEVAFVRLKKSIEPHFKPREVSEWARLVKTKARIMRSDRRRALRAVESGEDHWEDALRRNHEGEVRPTFENACMCLDHEYGDRLSYDTMASRPYLDGRPVGDLELLQIRREFGMRWATYTKEDLADALVLVGSERKKFHPVEDYLRGLVWDGVRRLDSAAHDLLGVPKSDRLSAIMLKRTMIAGVARGFAKWEAEKPEATDDERRGAKVDTVLVLLGWQGAKKSELFGVLGAPWVLDSPVELTDRRGPITMHTAWIVEWAEVDRMVMRSTDSDTKNATSRRDDQFIPIFGRAPVKALRSYICGATTNKRRFLTDATGDRRWWVIDLYFHGPDWKVDARRVAAAKGQLWAEAVHEYDQFKRLQREGVPDDENPHRWWLDNAEEAERRARCTAHHVEDGWEELVRRWIDGEPRECPRCRGAKSAGPNPCGACDGRGKVAREPLRKDERGVEYVTASDVLSGALDVPRERHRTSTAAVAETLRALGWTPREGDTRGGTTRYYAGAEYEAEERRGIEGEKKEEDQEK